MSIDYHPVRIETLIALALSKRWPRDDPDVDAVEGVEAEAGKENGSGANEDLADLNGGLPFVFRG